MSRSPHCVCGHDLTKHQTPGTECAAPDCTCTRFHERAELCTCGHSRWQHLSGALTCHKCGCTAYIRDDLVSHAADHGATP